MSPEIVAATRADTDELLIPTPRTADPAILCTRMRRKLAILTLPDPRWIAGGRRALPFVKAA